MGLGIGSEVGNVGLVVESRVRDVEESLSGKGGEGVKEMCLQNNS
jgi:hypothetical protein